MADRRVLLERAKNALFYDRALLADRAMAIAAIDEQLERLAKLELPMPGFEAHEKGPDESGPDHPLRD